MLSSRSGLAAGEVLQDHYRIEGRLGEGGLAVVYRAIDLHLNMPVAVKQLKKSQYVDTGMDRFLREARMQAHLVHQNIVSIRHVFKEEDEYFIVMEFVEGQTMADLIGTSKSFPRMSLRQLHGLFSQLLDGLGYAHQKEIIHRDIKPCNIMVTPDFHVKIADFGLAFVPTEQRLTQTGMTQGTPAYMSPEQLQGKKDIDGRTDIYSVGVSLFEALCGSIPFLMPNEQLVTFELMGRQLFMNPHPPARFGVRASAQLVQVLECSMAKEPAARYQTCEEFSQALTAALQSDPLWDTEPSSEPHVAFDALARPQESVWSKIVSSNDQPAATLATGDFGEGPMASPQGPSDGGTRTMHGQDSANAIEAHQHLAAKTKTRRSPFKFLFVLFFLGILGGLVWQYDEVEPLVLSWFQGEPTPTVRAPATRRSSPRVGRLGTILTPPAHDTKHDAGAPTKDDTSGTHATTPTPVDAADAGSPDSHHAALPTTPPDASAPTGARPPVAVHIPVPSAKAPYPKKLPGVSMVKVPQGDFLLGRGSRRSRQPHAPQRKIWLDTYWLDQFEVSVGQYRACVRAGVCRTHHKMIFLSQIDMNKPIVRVSWADAANFCRWSGKTLPTEAQWEKAARGLKERSYPWGETPPTCAQANFSRCSFMLDNIGPKRRAAGRSTFGAYDMSGNVWEWTRDCYNRRSYRSLAAKNPVARRRNCRVYVLRGGGWDSAKPKLLKSYTRRGGHVLYRHASVGFRCAWNPKP